MKSHFRGVLAALLLGACAPAPEALTPTNNAGVVAAASDTSPSQSAQTPLLAADPGAPARLALDVELLASPGMEGRGTGQPGARAAAEHIARRFASLALQPLGGAPEMPYLQAFQARIGARVGVPLLLVKGGVPAAPNQIITAEGAETGDANAATVFVGHGITAKALGWDDYKDAQIQGKIAVILDGVPAPRKGTEELRDFGAVRYKLRTAREHGAVAAIIVRADDSLPPPPADATAMGLPGVVVTKSLGKKLFPSIDGDAERARAARGWPTLHLTTSVEPEEGPAWNVVALLPADPASATRDEVIVVGAHYDHLGFGGSASRAPGVRAIHPGADDNASGTALLLEVAQRLVTLGQKPPRAILFTAFGAEEIGTIGSRYFIDHPPVPLKSMALMINADMVGRLRNNRLVVDGVGTAEGLEPMIREVGADLGFDFAFGSEGFGASDHTSFTSARVPVAFFFTGVHDDYHMPSDTADRIEYQGLSRISLLAARLAWAGASRKDRLAFVDAPSGPHQGMRGGFRVSLGTIPDYAFSGKGVRLSGTRADAPAARAGLLAGDVIVRVGEHAITNVHDYVFALGDLTPGAEVEIEIERSNQRQVVRVIPAPGR